MKYNKNNYYIKSNNTMSITPNENLLSVDYDNNV